MCDYGRVKALRLKHGSGDGESTKLKAEKKRLLSKMKNLKESTQYNKFYEYKDINNTRKREEMITDMIDLLLKYNVDINRINFDKLDKNELQLYLSRMQWALGVFDGLVNELSVKTEVIEEKNEETDKVGKQQITISQYSSDISQLQQQISQPQIPQSSQTIPQPQIPQLLQSSQSSQLSQTIIQPQTIQSISQSSQSIQLSQPIPLQSPSPEPIPQSPSPESDLDYINDIEIY